MIKVVHIASNMSGGAGIAARRIHDSLMQNGSVSSSIVQMNPLLASDVANNIYRCTHYHSLSYRIKKRLGILPYLSRIEKFQKIIEKQPKDYEFVSLPFSYFPIHEHPVVKEADIINLHWTADFLDIPSFFYEIKQPIVWTLHDANPFLGIFHYQGDMHRNMSNHVLKKLDNKILLEKTKSVHLKNNIHIVSPSMWLQEQSMGSKTFGDYRHSVIANPFDHLQYPELNKESCKTILNKKDKPSILFVAENIQNHRKGMDLLLDALKAIPSQSFNLMSVGAGAIDSLLSTDINYTNFGKIKNRDILNLIYTAADITIIPSREDNLPNVMLESMLNGTPVLSFNNGGMAEHIETGKNGILVTELTADALAHAINDFLEQKYNFDHKKIRQYPITNMNYQKQALEYIGLYKSILNR